MRFSGAGSGDDAMLGAGGGQLRSIRYTPPPPPPSSGRAVPVTVVDDDLDSVWTVKMNGTDGIVASSSDADDNSSSFSSSVADPSTEYVYEMTYYVSSGTLNHTLAHSFHSAHVGKYGPGGCVIGVERSPSACQRFIFRKRDIGCAQMWDRSQ